MLIKQLILIIAIMFVFVNAQCQNALVLQTDFGTKDGAVAAMKGVAFGVEHTLPIFDLTHDITAFEIWEAGYRLWQTVPYWPSGTVFVSVVDPGVGTDRKAIVVLTKTGHYIVTPDNGTITLLAESLGIAEVRQIDETRNRLPGSTTSHTFHGRDIFAYTGARLASGKIQWQDVGPSLGQSCVLLSYTKAERQGQSLIGTIPVLDPAYGNVWTNIPKDMISQLEIQIGQLCKVKIWNNENLIYEGNMPYVHSFGDVPIGQPLLYSNSLWQMAIALNMDNFAQKHQIRAGASWRVQITRVVQQE